MACNSSAAAKYLWISSLVIGVMRSMVNGLQRICIFWWLLVAGGRVDVEDGIVVGENNFQILQIQFDSTDVI